MDDDRGSAGTDGRSSALVARWAGTLGVLIPGVAIPVYPIWLFPSAQASGAEIARWVSAHQDRLVASQLLYTVGVGLWLVFGAAVWVQLRERLPAGSPLAAGFGVGFVSLVTMVLGGFTVFNVQIYRPRSAELSTVLYDLAFGTLAMSGIPAAITLGCFAIAVYRHGVMRRSTAYVAAVAAVAHVLLLVAFIAPTGPLSLQGFLVVWGIPLLLFAWIGHTARTITAGTAIES